MGGVCGRELGAGISFGTTIDPIGAASDRLCRFLKSDSRLPQRNGDGGVGRGGPEWRYCRRLCASWRFWRAFMTSLIADPFTRSQFRGLPEWA